MVRRRTGKALQLTHRDLQILRCLDRYRFLRSTHLHNLVGGKSKKRFVERLGDLYHEGGYVDRPRQQWQTVNARYVPVVYELAAAGRALLRQHGMAAAHSTVATGTDRERPYRQFQHELMITDILASIEIGVRANPTLHFIDWSEILASPRMPERTRRSARPMAMGLTIITASSRTQRPERYDQPLMPDAVFGLAYRVGATRRYRFFALEADRATQPLQRRTLRQSSYLRKVLQYREVVTHALYQSRWGVPNLFVLTVTTNERRRENMMRLVDRVTGGQGSPVLLFKTMPSLAPLQTAPLPVVDFLTGPWHRVGYRDFFIDRLEETPSKSRS